MGTVLREGVPSETAADDALARETGDVGNASEDRAVNTGGRVRGEGQHATTTYITTRQNVGGGGGKKSVSQHFSRCSTQHTKTSSSVLTAFEIVRDVDALPRTGTTAKDTAGGPFGPLVRAQTAPDPSLLGWLRPGRGTRAGSHAVAVADDRGRRAHAIRRVGRRGSRKAVRALESAWISTDADWCAVRWVSATWGVPSDLMKRDERTRSSTFFFFFLNYQRTSRVRASVTTCSPAMVTARIATTLV